MQRTRKEDQDRICKAEKDIRLDRRHGMCACASGGRRTHETELETVEEGEEQHVSHMVMSREGQQRVLHTRIHDTRNIHAFLDSGAETHMFRDGIVFRSVGNKETDLITACGSAVDKGVIGQTHSLYVGGHEIVGKARAVQCGALVDNLISVGKICEAGHTVVFTHTHSAIYRGVVDTQGECVHKQERNVSTGLYDITLHIGEGETKENVSRMSSR